MKPPSQPRRFPGAIRTGLFLHLLLLCSFPAGGAAQVFQVQGGASTLFDARGGQVSFQAPGYSGWAGAGMLHGRFTLGGLVRTRVNGYTVSAGDDYADLSLPTDVFGTSSAFLVRGLGVSGDAGAWRFRALTGSTAVGAGAPFFGGARRDRALGLLFAERDLNSHLRLVVRSVFGQRQTSIAGLEFRPRPGLTAALAAGSGSGRPFGAASLTADFERLSLKAGFTGMDRSFRRVLTPVPLQSESDRDNLQADFRPLPGWSLSASRRRFLSPAGLRIAPGLAARMHSVSGGGRLGEVRLGAGYFHSQTQGLSSSGLALSAGREIVPRVDGAFRYYRSVSALGAIETYSGQVSETFSARLRLQQVVTHTEGHTSLAFGGDYNSGRFSVGVSHNVMYVPFRPERPWVRAVAVHLRLRPFGSVQVQGGTFVAPDGTVRWTASGSDYFYRYAGLEPGARPANGTFPRYIVRGQALDEEGAPVAGAAFEVNGELVFSDQQGRFFVRLRRTGPHAFRVALGQFLTPVPYEVVRAPERVRGGREPAAEEEVRVVLRPARQSRRPAQPAAPRAGSLSDSLPF